MTQSVSLTLLTNPELERLFQTRFDLKTGDKLEGKVLQVLSDGKVLVDFGKFQAAVELKVPVKEGDVIHLVVVEKGKQLKLKIESVEFSNSESKTTESVEIPVNRENIQHKTEEAIKDIRTQIDRLAQKIVIPEDTQNNYENLKTALQLLQSKLQSADSTSELPTEIKQVFQNIHSDLKLAEMSDTIIKQLTQLKTLVENSGAPDEKLTKEIVDTLSGMLTRLNELKDNNQFREMEDFLQNQVKPQLKSLAEIFISSKSMREIENPQRIEEIIQTVRSLQNNVEIALTPNEETVKIPGLEKKIADLPRDLQNTLSRAMNNPNPKESIAAISQIIELHLEQLPEMGSRIHTLLNTIKTHIDALPETPVSIKSQPQTEDIQNIYENIKTALQLLQSRLQVAGNTLDLPEEIKQVFQNVQADLKLAEMSDTIIKQLTQLKTFVENSGIPYEKLVKEIVDALTLMITRLTELKNNNQFQEMGAFIQNQLKPQLKSLADIFSNSKSMSEVENQQKIKEIMQTVQSLQKNVESALTPTEETAQTPGLTQFPGLEKKIFAAISNSNPKESIAALTKNIEALLERLPGNTSTTSKTGNETALPGKIRALLDTLQAHFDPLDIGDDALKLVPRLKSLIEDSGIFFEKKISDVITKLSEASSRMQDIKNFNQLPEIRSIIENDLKPNLLQLREFLNNEKLSSQMGDQKTLDTIRSGVKDLLNNINTQQNRAIESQANREPVQVFTFSLPIKNEEPAELKVFYNRERKKDSPDEYKLSLLLVMDKLGEVRSDFFYLKKDLTITFFVKDQRIKDFIDENLHEITGTLEPEFKSLNLNVIVSEERIAAFETEEKEAEYITEKAVNIKI